MADSSNAPNPDSFQGAHLGAPLPSGKLVAFSIAVLAIILVACLSYGPFAGSLTSARRVTHTLQTVEQSLAVLSALQDAECCLGISVRNEITFVARQQEAALASSVFKSARSLVSGNLERQRRLDTLERVAAEKMAELEQKVELRRIGNAADKLTIVRTNRGKEAMERARVTVAEMQRAERGTLASRQAEWLNSASVSSVAVLGGSRLLLVLVAAAALRTSRDYRVRQTQEWIRSGARERACTPYGYCGAQTNSDGLRAAPHSHRGTVANTVIAESLA